MVQESGQCGIEAFRKEGKAGYPQDPGSDNASGKGRAIAEEIEGIKAAAPDDKKIEG